MYNLNERNRYKYKNLDSQFCEQLILLNGNKFTTVAPFLNESVQVKNRI